MKRILKDIYFTMEDAENVIKNLDELRSRMHERNAGISGEKYLIEFAETVFERVDDRYFVKKSRQGNLVLGGMYSENFVKTFVKHNQNVVII
jgi:hypothetical protein